MASQKAQRIKEAQEREELLAVLEDLKARVAKLEAEVFPQVEKPSKKASKKKEPVVEEVLEEVLEEFDEALEEYKTFTAYYTYSSLLSKAYKDIANIYFLCGNKIMFDHYIDLSKGKTKNKLKVKSLSNLRRGVA